MSIFRKMNYQYFLTPILIISMLLTPLYHAGVFQAQAAPIVDAAVASTVDSYTDRMADLPPLSMWNTPLPANVADSKNLSGVESVAAQSGSGATDTYATRVIDTDTHLASPTDTVTISDMNNALGPEDGIGGDIKTVANNEVTHGCVVVSLGGVVEMNGGADAVAARVLRKSYGNDGGGVVDTYISWYISNSITPPTCDDTSGLMSQDKGGAV